MKSRLVKALLIVMPWCMPVAAQPMPDSVRGELLYKTHCIACHTTEVHWRDRRVAKDWQSLLSEVRLWQKTANLDWREKDIIDVTQYLNTEHYHFAGPKVSRSPVKGATTLKLQN